MTDEERLTRLEEKIEALADQFAALDKKLSNSIRIDELDKLDLRMRLNAAEASISDFREVERMAQEA